MNVSKRHALVGLLAVASCSALGDPILGKWVATEDGTTIEFEFLRDGTLVTTLPMMGSGTWSALEGGRYALNFTIMGTQMTWFARIDGADLMLDARQGGAELRMQRPGTTSSVSSVRSQDQTAPPEDSPVVAAQAATIVGQWRQSDDSGLTMEFRSDGTWTFSLYNTPNAEGRWRALDEDEFQIENSTTGESGVARIVGSRMIGLGRDYERM